MTKADLVDRVTALGDQTRRDGEIIVDTLFESVIGALKAGDKIEIRGFGVKDGGASRALFEALDRLNCYCAGGIANDPLRQGKE